MCQLFPVVGQLFVLLLQLCFLISDFGFHYKKFISTHSLGKKPAPNDFCQYLPITYILYRPRYLWHVYNRPHSLHFQQAHFLHSPMEKPQSKTDILNRYFTKVARFDFYQLLIQFKRRHISTFIQQFYIAWIYVKIMIINVIITMVTLFSVLTCLPEKHWNVQGHSFSKKQITWSKLTSNRLMNIYTSYNVCT